MHKNGSMRFGEKHRTMALITFSKVVDDATRGAYAAGDAAYQSMIRKSIVLKARVLDLLISPNRAERHIMNYLHLKSRQRRGTATAVVMCVHPQAARICIERRWEDARPRGDRCGRAVESQNARRSIVVAITQNRFRTFGGGR